MEQQIQPANGKLSMLVPGQYAVATIYTAGIGLVVQQALKDCETELAVV